METTEYTINKSTIDCYKIRSGEFYWADITVDASGNQGRIQIMSDFGNWQNYWGACGCSFNEFLIGLDIHYAANKFGASEWFNLDETISFLSEDIEEVLDGELKITLLEELEELKVVSSKEEFIHVVQTCDAIMEFSNYSPHLSYSIEPNFKRFWAEIWPVFIEEINK